MVQRLTSGRMWAAVLAMVFALPLAAEEKSPWWPQFHGPERDNISREQGLLKSWPAEGPPLAWKFDDCGRGYSGVAIADGKIFTAGDFGQRELLLALDLNGRLLWKAANGASWRGSHPGSRTTPTYDKGVLYHMNPTGRLAAYRAGTGQELWAVDLQQRFGARYGTWAMAENVVVDGSNVVCLPGGTKALVAALDKKSGRTVWSCTGPPDTAAYCSPIVVQYRGTRHWITLTQKHVIAVDLDTGKLLWSHPHLTRHDQNVTSPVFHEGYVFVTSGHQAGGRLLKINPDLHSVTELWAKTDLDNCHGGVLLVDGRLYGSACRLGKTGFFCADLLTGRRYYSDTTLGKLSLTCADGRLYGLSDRGRMVLMEITPGGLNITGDFQVPKENTDRFFAHPVVCGGRLYVRHGNDLYAYDIRDRRAE